MSNIGYSTLTVIPSAKGFGSALSGQVDPQMRDSGARGGKHFGGGMVKSAKSFVGPLAALFAAKIGFDFFKSAVDGASDLAESASKVKVVFGDQSDAIMRASKTSATAMGLSKQAYLDATGGLGNLLVSLKIAPKAAANMSQEMVKLAGDLASFNNVSPEEALAAIQSGLTGETEPLKRFGVNMNDATLKAQALKMHLIKTTKEAMSPQTKALAAQALIMAQTGTAQGDFARTSGGLANQQRIAAASAKDLKDKLGTALLPAVTKLTEAGNKAMVWLGKNPAAMKALGVAALALGAALAVVALSAFAIPLAIAAVVGGLVYAYTKVGWFRKGVDTAFKAMGAIARWLWNNVYQPFFKFLGHAIGNAMILVGKMLQALSKVPGFGWVKKYADAMVSGGAKARDMANNINKIPDKKNVHASQTGFQAVINMANRLNTAVRASNRAKLHYSTGGSGGIPQNAMGTDNWRGGLTWVGERGPEIVNLPKGSQVIPNHKLNTYSSSGGAERGSVTINQTNNMAQALDANEVGRAAANKLLFAMAR